MRVLFLVALCLAVAFARQPYSTNRSQYQRLLRALQQEQQQDDGFCGRRCQQQKQQQQQRGGNFFSNELDDDEQEFDQNEEGDEYYQRQGQQYSSRQQFGGLNLDDDEQDQYEQQGQECDQDDYQCKRRQQQQYNDQDGSFENEDNDQYERQQGQWNQQQGQRNQWNQQQQGQRQQCQPKYQLLQTLEQPNVQLAAKLYKQAKQENDDKNTVVSPASLQLALAAIQRGARGQTKRQLQRVTGAGLTQKQIRQAHAALQQALNGQGPLQRQQNGQQQQQPKVKTSTIIVINQRNRAQRQFIQSVRTCLNVQVKQCNFQRQPQQCRQQINRFIAQKTQHKLQQTVPQDAVTENTKLIVVNTAQVKARWGRQFLQRQQTRHARFFPLGSQQPKPVQVLQSQGRFNYYEDEQLKVVGLPTQQQELTLYMIVPKNKDGLNQVEKSHIQDGQQLKQLLEQAEQQRQNVRVQLPKFQIKHKLDAKQTLRKQGVQDVFDADEADLSGINGQQQQQQEEQYEQQYNQQGQQGDEQTQGHKLHVNKLIHQATIKVDEQGISAARPYPGQQDEFQSQYGQQQQQYGQQYESEQQYGQDDGEDDEQEQQYHQKQYRHQELFDDIFGQRGQRQQQGSYRRNKNVRFQSQFDDDEQDNDQYEQEDGQQYYPRGQRGQYNGQQKQVKANRAFAFALKHNPSNQIVLVGRVVDATQKPKPHGQQGQQQGQQSLNGVDQQ